jgi:hypothetical protein
MLRTISSNRFVRMSAAVAIFLAIGQYVQASGEATRLRILLVIDTDAPGAADFGAAHDRDNMKNALINGLRRDRLPHTLDILQGANATPERVIQYYERLKVSPNEAFLFYYTGHGGMDATQGQLLTMKHGVLPRAQLRAAMMKRAPKLAVILTDCCSSGMPLNSRAPSEGPAPKANPTSRLGRSNSVLRDLFFRHEGMVVIAAARVGQEAAGEKTRGSHFTVAFTGLLNQAQSRFDSNRDGLVEWREFFPALNRETARVSNNRHSPQAFALAQAFAP